MHCKEISNLVMKYFDGNISELEREMIIRHNESCCNCAEEFTILKEAMDALEDFSEIDVPIGFESSIMEEIRTWKPYSLSSKVVVLWLISILGLMIFTWNMVIFVAIPFINASGILIAAQNVFIYCASIVSNTLSQLLVTASVLLGKLLVLRNVLLRDYGISLVMSILAFMGINMFLLHRRRLQEG